MELKNFKPLIILVAVIISLLFVVLIINISSNSHSTSQNKKEKENIDYPEISDSEEDILAKIYNEKYDYYTGFINKSGEKDNIFGNEKEVTAKNLDEKTRLSLALYSFDLEDMEKISCSTINWNSSWNDSCGSNSGNNSYFIPVGELNTRVREIFNISPDYSNLNIEDLTIGSCTGDNKDSYIFRYIKDKSIFVSTKRAASCVNNGKLTITDIQKTQAGNLLTLTVSYNKREVLSLGQRKYYGNERTYQDKFFFKVKEDGSYYFNSSTLIKNSN